MRAREYEMRQRRIAEGCCPRCGLPVKPWPLKRADRCHAGRPMSCPRQWDDILKAEAAIVVSK